MDPPTGDDDGPVRDPGGPVELVGGEDDSGTSEGGLGDDAIDEVATLGVEPGMGLVEEPELGAAGGDDGDGGPTPLAGGETIYSYTPQPPIEPEPIEGALRGGDADATGASREPDVLLDSEVAIEEPGVAEEPDEAPDGSGVDPQVVTEDHGVALGDPGEPRAGAEQRGLASAVWSSEVDDLARSDDEVDARERGEPAEEADGGAKEDSGVHRRRPTVLVAPRQVPSSESRRSGGDTVRVVVRGFGKTLIGTGLLILLFVAYQLWGTNLAEARSQNRLEKDFAEALAGSPVVSAPPSTVAGRPATTQAPPPAPPPAPTGEAVAVIRIPRIGLEKFVVEGVGVSDLKKGPGHYPSTPLPGQPGNAAIAGHRTTYGAPFDRIDELQVGDVVEVRTLQGDFTYKVFETKIVSPSAVEVISPTVENQLTLTSCHPKLSARQRIVVVARLAPNVTPAPPPPTTTTLVPKPNDPPPPAAPEVEEEFGLGGDTSARLPALLWGLACAALAVAAWVWGKRWRRWAAYGLSTPLLFVLLFFWFEQITRLLPANV
jgi:sortase A